MKNYSLKFLNNILKMVSLFILASRYNRKNYHKPNIENISKDFKQTSILWKKATPNG